LLDDIVGARAELDDAGRPTHAVLRKLAQAVCEFGDDIANNARAIPNYGERYRCKERISTGFVESTINQLIANRWLRSTK
jgi:hypothetical protein